MNQNNRKLFKMLLLALLIQLVVLHSGGAQILFQAETVVGNTAGHVHVPITVSQFTDVTGFEFVVQLPEEYVSLVTIDQVNEELEDFDETYYGDLGEGRIQVMWVDPLVAPVTLQDGDPLFTLVLELTGEAPFEAPVMLEELTAINANSDILPTTPMSGGLLVGLTTFDAGEVVAGVGTIVDVPVTARNFIDIAGFQFALDFDPDKATFIGLTDPNQALTGFGNQSFFSPDAGRVNVLWDQPGLINTTIDDDELLFNIRLQVANTPSEPFPIGIENVQAFDNQPVAKATASLPGRVTILDYIVISGQVHNAADSPVPQVELVVEGITNEPSAITGTDGRYDFNLLPSSPFELVPQKNDSPVNGLNVADILFLRGHLLGSRPLGTPYQIIAGDIDASGDLTVADIIQLRKLLLGTSTQLDPSWRFVPADYLFSNETMPLNELFPESRRYASPSGNQLDQDFVAIKVGDLDQTHQLEAARLASASIQFGIGSKETLSGSTVKLPVYVLSGYTNLVGWQGSFTFDPYVLRYEGYTNGVLEISDLNIGNTEATSGRLRFLYDQPSLIAETFTDLEPLFYLLFEVIGTPGQQSTLMFDGATLPLAAYDSGLNQREILPSQPGTIDIANLEVDVFPNPGSHFTLTLTLPEAETWTWRVVDTHGQELLRGEEVLEAGAHTRALDASDWSNGTYFLESQVKETTQTERIIVVK